MKVLNISLEKKLFENNSEAQQRVTGYSRLFARFDLIVLTSRGYRALNFGNMNIFPTNSFGRLSSLVDAYLLSKKIIKKYEHDVISVQDPFEIGFLGWLLAKKFKIKLQIQIHGDYFDSDYWRKGSFLNGFRYHLGCLIIKKADSIRVVSNRIKNSLIKLGLEPEKIIIAPIHVKMSRVLSPESKNFNNEAKNRFVFLTVGRLVPVKNIDLQIKSIAEITRKYTQVELWIVGEGLEYKNLKFEVEKLRLSHSVKLLGQKNKEELEKIYNEADAFLLTSNSEGWSLVAIEAASFGLPIIMTDVGCANEIIEDGVSGIVIPVGDGQILGRAMAELIENSELRKNLSRNALAAVLNLPSQEQSWQLYKKSLEKAFG